MCIDPHGYPRVLAEIAPEGFRLFRPSDRACVAAYNSAPADDNEMALCMADRCLMVQWPLGKTHPLVDFRVSRHSTHSESENDSIILSE